MTSTLDFPKENNSSNDSPSPEDEELWKSAEEAEAVLEAMARSLAPAESTVQELAATLFEAASRDASQLSQQGVAPTAEQALRKAQARYQALVEQIPAITFMAPLDGTVSELYVSPQIEQMLGFSAQEWLNNPILWYQQLHPEDQDRWQEMFARTLNAGEHFRADYRFISREGKTVWIHGEAKVISDDYGVPLFLQGVAFDITEQKEAEEKLQAQNIDLAKARDQAMEASRAKSAFLANMSHELRTPLHAIMGFSEMLQEDAEDQGLDGMLPDLQKINSSAQHLVGLISNILDLSKIEAGKMDVYLESFNLDQMLQDVVSSVDSLSKEQGNTLVYDLEENLGYIYADLTKVKQIVLNLISNACKFTTQGTVTLKGRRFTQDDSEWVRLDVIDTGVGISEENVKKLFQSFSQGDESTTRKYGGTGLGLAISRRFSQIMGGSIQVQSKEGVGSTFSIELPVEVEALEDETWLPPEEELHVEESEVAEVPTQTTPTVLVIDADQANHEAINKALDSHDVEVLTASSCEEGMQLAWGVKPAAVVLQVGDAQGEGWNSLSRLKNDSSLATTPVVLFTYDSESDQGYFMGTLDHVVKPVNELTVGSILNRFEMSGRALVVDDDEDHRHQLGHIIEQRGWYAESATDGWKALQSIADDAPDLIVLNLLMGDMDGFEFVRLLRKTEAGRTIPVVTFTESALSENEHQRLVASSQAILQRASVSRPELFAEVGQLVARHVEAAQRIAQQSEESNTPSLESQVLAQLQAQLRQAQAERDHVVEQLQLALSQEQSGHGQPEEVTVLQQELQQARQHLREQQQTVSLLRSEFDEAIKQQDDIENLQDELNALQAERNANAEALTQLRESQQELENLRAERAVLLAQIENQNSKNQDVQTQQNAAVVETLQELKQEIDGLRKREKRRVKKERIRRQKKQQLKERRSSQGSQPKPTQEAVPTAQELSTQSEAENEPVELSPSAQAVATASAASNGESQTLQQTVNKQETTMWYLIYQDSQGRPQSSTGSTDEIKDWLTRGLLENAHDLYISPSPNGPFEPVRYYPEFAAVADVLTPTSSTISLPDEKQEEWQDPSSNWQPDSVVNQSEEASNEDGPANEWLVWLIPIVVGIGTALLVKNLWFQ